MPAKLTQHEANELAKIASLKKNIKFEPFVYNGKQTKLKLKCEMNHNWNTTSFTTFVKSDSGCPTCNNRKAGLKRMISNDNAVQRLLEKCTNLNYTFDNFIYNGNNKTYLTLYCDKKHKFSRTYQQFMFGNRLCPTCSNTDSSIKRILEYDKVMKEIEKKCNINNFICGKFEYKGTMTKLPLTCKECYNFWETTSYNTFIYSGVSCPYCFKLEAKCISRDLDPYFDEVIKEKEFDELRYKRKLKYDRYISYINTLLEYDGEYHFKVRSGKFEQYKQGRIRDQIKTDYAINNGYNFIRIKYTEDHVKALKSFLVLVLKHPDKQIVQIHGEVQILDKQ